jgi:uncharacterized phage protein gp47/JayE
MAYGVTAAGFVRKRQENILASMVASIEGTLGPINQNADSVIMQVLTPAAEEIALAWEAGEGSYLGVYPATAEGVQLSYVATLKNLTRIAAAKSTAVIAALGTASTVIPISNQFKSSTTDDVFESDAAVTILQTNVVRIQIEVTTAADSQTFTITIDGTPYAYVSGVGATKQQIVTGLIAALASGSAPMTGVDDGTGDSLTLTANDSETGYNVTVAATGAGVLTVLTIETPVAVTALTTGPKLVNAGQIDTIVNPVAGLTSVTNIGDGDQGRDVETDAELRLRINAAVQGAATVEAIRTRVLNEVTGVSTVLVTDNRTDATVGGLLPHSILVVVQGGADQDIADKIWEVGGAGIATNGTVTKTVVDSQGNNQTIKFSRPTSKYAHVRATLTLYNEESVGSGAEDAIKAAILAFGAAFRIGEDMLWQRFLGPIFDATPGIKSIQMELAVTSTPGGTPSYVTDTDVAIASDELAVFALARITVVGL